MSTKDAALPLNLWRVTVGGPDALSFLNSQLTVDPARSSPDCWHVSGWCDPKGRCLFIILYRCHEDGVDLVVPGEQADPLLNRLKMFAIRRRVELESSTPLGPSTKSGFPLRCDGSRRLSESTGPIDRQTWTDWLIADWRIGMPWLNVASSGRHLPQWLGLDRLGGLSYDKGCYPGQEVIARVHYLGKSVQQLVRFRLDEPKQAVAGEAMVEAGGKRVGEVLWSVVDGQACLGLATIATETASSMPQVLIQGREARLSHPERLC